MVDLVLRGGLVVDGNRGEPQVADVCITDGVITAIESDYQGPCKESLDVSGKVVSPGFIDLHSHSDVCPFASFHPESKIYQGVTLELAGNCGVSIIPRSPAYKAEQTQYFTSTTELSVSPEVLTDDNLEQYTQHVNSLGYPSNIGMLVGHGTLRGCVMGFQNREPSPEELEEMKRILDQELSAGAAGMSLGLIYPPGSFSKTPELVELAKVVKKHGKILTVHMRSEGPAIFEAVDEMLQVTRESGVHLQISHLKLMGKPQWGRAQELLDKLDAARAEGMTITCDQYPYPATSTALSALLPKWAYEGGAAKALERLQEGSKQLLDDIAAEMERRGGANTIMVSSSHGLMKEIEGKMVSEIAEMLGKPAPETVADILVKCRGGIAAIYFTLSEEDVRLIMKDMRITVGSDGYAFSLDPSITKTSPHPRSFGTFPKFLQTVREYDLMPVQDAVYKMTALGADILGLSDRGRLEVGKVADITVFDWQTVSDRCAFTDSLQVPAGIDHVLVGGSFVIENAKPTGARPGKMVLCK